jgi:hypothetical protein
MDGAGVVLECRRGVRPQRGAHRVGGYMRMSVAIAADPAAQRQERRDRLSKVGRTLELTVESRDLAQEGRSPVGERVLDLVVDGQLRGPQHARLPQRRDGRAQLLVQFRVPLGRRGGARFDQRRDRSLGIEDALAPHLGRMRGQHRHQAGIREERGEPAAAGAARVQRRYCVRQRSRPVGPVGRLSPHQMSVLGDVGQMREITERANDRDGVVARQPAQQGVEALRRCRILVAPKAQRGLAYFLDRLVQRVALVRAQHLAEQLAQQADVVPQRLIDAGDAHRVSLVRIMHESSHADARMPQ